MPRVKAENISYEYKGKRVLSDISFDIKGPAFVSVLGANGSGKSTLMRLIDGFIMPSSGNLWVNGLSVKEPEAIPEIRHHIGFIFQDPDSQFVSPVLEEDVAFGAENLGLEDAEIEKRVHNALKVTGLEAFRTRSPFSLSGGEKERAAISGVIAYGPDILILDEPFSMLDDDGRKEMLNLVRSIASDKLVFYVTHRAEDALFSDSVMIIDSSRIIAMGSARDVLYSDAAEKAIRLPLAVRMAKRLRLESKPVTEDELEEALCS